MLLAQIDCICSLIKALERYLSLKPSFLARLSVWHRQSTKLGSQKIATAHDIISTMQIGLRSRSSICQSLFNLTAGGHLHPAKLRSTAFSMWLLANSQVLIKILSNFLFASIPLDGKRGGNKCAFGKKIFSEATFLIFLLHNSFKDTSLLFLLYPLIVSSSFCLPIAGLNVNIFGKNNIRKSRKDDPETKTQGNADRKDNLGIGVDTNKEIRANNLGTETDVDARTDGGTGADNPSIGIDLGKRIDADTGTNNLDTITNNSDIAADNPSIV